MKNAKEVLNDLFVEVFNSIVALEYKNIKEKDIDLSITEIHVLSEIENSNIPTMNNIAKRLSVTPGTLTVSVNKLVEKGYVIKSNSSDDKRKTILSLTDKSIYPLSFHNKFHEEMIDNVIKDLHIDDNSELIVSLSNLSDYFKSKKVIK